MNVIKILIVDGKCIVRDGIRQLLDRSGKYQIVEAGTKEEALHATQTARPQVVLLDLNIKGGLELLRSIPAEEPGARVIVFSSFLESVYARQALKSGAKGYVSLSADVDLLEDAINKVADGGYYIDGKIASIIADKYSGDGNPIDELNLREVEILRLLGIGNSLSEIAATLGVAYKTVANSCSIMKKKLRLQRTEDLIKFSNEHLHSDQNSKE